MQLATVTDLAFKRTGIFEEIFETPNDYIHIPCAELTE